MTRIWHVLVQRLKKSPFVSMTAVMVLLLSVGLMVFGLPQKAELAEIPASQAAPAPQKVETGKLSFVAFGDNGSGMLQQQWVAAQLIKSYEEKPYPLVLMLGDNIYPDGNVKQFGEAYFNKPYAPLLKAGVQFKVVLGNHDVLRGYDNDQVKFFHMPAKYYDFAYGPVHFYALDTNRFDARQAQWLESRLKACGKAQPWQIVYGHHPVYSSGLHGNSKTLINMLQPLLEKYHVDMYLAGHDHDYERFALRNGVQYLVSGGGGASLRKFLPEPAQGSLLRMSVLHFLRLDVDGHTLTFKVIGTDGEVLDQGKLTHVTVETDK